MKTGNVWVKYAEAFKVFCSSLRHVEPGQALTQGEMKVVCKTMSMSAPISDTRQHGVQLRDASGSSGAGSL